MESAGLVALVAAGAFAATNLDNLLIGTAVLARPGQPAASLFGGVGISLVLILALCVVGGLIADYAPIRGLELLGLIPIGLGLRELARLRGVSLEEEEARSGPVLSASAVAALMLSNSADTFAVLAPLFAETRTGLLPAAVVAVVATACLGCAIAQRIATSERLGPLLGRLAPQITPFVLIIVGVYVLTDTATDAVP